MAGLRGERTGRMPTRARAAPYAVKHNPAAYYTGLRGDCPAWTCRWGRRAAGRSSSDLTGGTLPAFSFVTPDLCNDTHDCSVATGDAWLQVVVREDPRLAGLPRRHDGRLPHLGRGRRLGRRTTSR